jgi:putative transposase
MRPLRRSPRLRDYDYATPSFYLVTFCTARRAECLGAVDDEGRVTLSARGEHTRAAWVALPTVFPGLVLDAMVVMPDHVHGVVGIGIGGPAVPLPRVVGKWKADATRRIGLSEGRRVEVWQRSFHDRILVGDRALALAREYVESNPARWAAARAASPPRRHPPP